jgi:hypothetical protein
MTEQRMFALKRDELLRIAAYDMEMALAAEPSAEIANQYLNLSTLVASFADYHSLLLAKQVRFFKELSHLLLTNVTDSVFFNC